MVVVGVALILKHFSCSLLSSILRSIVSFDSQQSYASQLATVLASAASPPQEITGVVVTLVGRPAFAVCCRMVSAQTEPEVP